MLVSLGEIANFFSFKLPNQKVGYHVLPYYEEIANDLRRKIFNAQMRELKKLVEQAVPNNKGGEDDD